MKLTSDAFTPALQAAVRHPAGGFPDAACSQPSWGTRGRLHCPDRLRELALVKARQGRVRHASRAGGRATRARQLRAPAQACRTSTRPSGSWLGMGAASTRVASWKLLLSLRSRPPPWCEPAEPGLELLRLHCLHAACIAAQLLTCSRTCRQHGVQDSVSWSARLHPWLSRAPVDNDGLVGVGRPQRCPGRQRLPQLARLCLVCTQRPPVSGLPAQVPTSMQPAPMVRRSGGVLSADACMLASADSHELG